MIKKTIKRIIILFILIYMFIIPKIYATDEIISSQMEALNLSSFITEGENYTKDIFPNINLNDILNSAIKGEVDNKSIFTNILSLFGNEIVSVISLFGSILIVIIIHSILKSFTENLESEGVSQIAYYIEYILIVTLVMANFANIIKLMKESISNLVGFINCLVPILLALMTASRKYSICYINTTINNICYCFYRKHNNFINSANYINSNNFRYSF